MNNAFVSASKNKFKNNWFRQDILLNSYLHLSIVPEFQRNSIYCEAVAVISILLLFNKVKYSRERENIREKKSPFATQNI